MRVMSLVSRRALSCCRFSSRCSVERENRGGLDVNDLGPWGGVRLGSDPWPIERPLLIMVLPDAWDSKGPAAYVSLSPTMEETNDAYLAR